MSKEKFGCNVYELIKKETKSDEEKQFLFTYNRKIPVLKNSSIMNMLCRMIEDIDFKYKKPRNDENINEIFDILFDKNVEIDTEIIKKLVDLKKKFNNKRNFKMQSDNIQQESNSDNSTDINSIDTFYEAIRNEAYEICSNSSVLANYLVYIVYKLFPNEPKDFAWYVCPEGIIENLKGKYDGHLELPVYDVNGVDYLGKKYSLSEVIM
ncbi:hypothetical protein D7X33_22640 [Butyricicoccus sp. 1XD8-22]|nr:hypothetical protein D7X33_22640 [Butyricicoccus sp. 1XD8-22]